MKSLEELKEIREKVKYRMNVRDNGEGQIRVVVGMATCGIAAGARPVLDAFRAEVERLGLSNVSVVQTGCIGVCRLEPVAEVFLPGQEKVTYVKLRPDMIPSIVEQHLAGHQVVTEYTIGAAE